MPSIILYVLKCFLRSPFGSPLGFLFGPLLDPLLAPLLDPLKVSILESISEPLNFFYAMCIVLGNSISNTGMLVTRTYCYSGNQVLQSETCRYLRCASAGNYTVPHIRISMLKGLQPNVERLRLSWQVRDNFVVSNICHLE